MAMGSAGPEMTVLEDPVENFSTRPLQWLYGSGEEQAIRTAGLCRPGRGGGGQGRLVGNATKRDGRKKLVGIGGHVMISLRHFRHPEQREVEQINTSTL
jgi:hypothetical protein